MSGCDLINLIHSPLLVFNIALHRFGDQAFAAATIQEADLPVQGGFEKIGVGSLHVLELVARGTDGEDEAQPLQVHQTPQVGDQGPGQRILHVLPGQGIKLIERSAAGRVR